MSRPAGQRPGQRLHTYSLGMLRDGRLRRILSLLGYSIGTGWPSSEGRIAVWGQKPVSLRGRRVATLTGAGLLTIEDGFLRSIDPGVTGAKTLSLIIDDLGIYYDAARSSRLETLIVSERYQATTDRARRGIDLLRTKRLSKYTPPVPQQDFGSGHVLIVDQTRGDASIPGAGASAQTFERMLEAARAEHPGAQIIVKGHPDAATGRRHGMIDRASLRPSERFLAEPVNPWDLIEGARAIYTVSSQIGYEAILAGRPVRCFGMAFYAGWGLSNDEFRCPRRTARPSPEDLFAACHLDYPVYYDPWRDQLCDFETVAQVLEAERDQRVRAPPTAGDVFHGVRLWKRRNVLAFRPPAAKPAVFEDDLATASRRARDESRHLWVWASKVSADNADMSGHDGPKGYVEDGFLRSVGLGAQLTQAASLVFDRQGIYFDPSRPSDLEALVERATQGEADTGRAATLRSKIISARVTKYNLSSRAEPIQQRQHVLLVPGQVEDDASIRRGCDQVCTNLGLLKQARAANPDAWIVYKPHPDVEAGLRKGAIGRDRAGRLANEIAVSQSAVDVLDRTVEVWTMTSLLGFEALMRGIPVTCLGTPFYAGWGLTRDLGAPCSRRTARPTLDQLVWATLIAYPQYRDPVSGLACTPELIVERLASGKPMRKARSLSKLQALFATQSWLWRR